MLKKFLSAILGATILAGATCSATVAESQLFVGGKVSEVEVKYFSDKKTAAGIGIGSTAAQVEAAYGKPDFVHKDKLIYRTDNPNLALKFEIKRGVVTEIKFGVDD